MNKAERLAELALQIREDFCAAYRAYESRHTYMESTYGLYPMATWDGGADRWGKRHKSAWERIASFVLKHRMDHKVLIREVFECKLGETLTPNILTSEEALRLYAAAPGRIREACRARYEANKAQLRKEVYVHQRIHPGSTEREAIEAVLLSATAELSPLFRYCLANSVGDLDTMARFRERAFWQYMRAVEAHDEFMGNVIPEDMRQEAYAFQEAHATDG